MKISDGIKHKGNPFWIPDSTRNAKECPVGGEGDGDDLPTFFKELGFKKGVEIGISWGQNIVRYAELGLEIYGVDPWDAETDEDKFRTIISLPGKYGSDIDDVYGLAKERTEKFPNCHLMKMTSMEALDHFPDRSLDFVYIDGNHSFGYVAMDLMKWNRKVRKGGVIAGHDYYSTDPVTSRRYRQVGNIVDAFAKTYDFTNWYVLGSKEPKEGERSDVNLSFVFFKHW